MDLVYFGSGAFGFRQRLRRYVRVREDHFSLAFTYAWMASQDQLMRGVPFVRIW
jgi:hypothetical protein